MKRNFCVDADRVRVGRTVLPPEKAARENPDDGMLHQQSRAHRAPLDFEGAVTRGKSSDLKSAFLYGRSHDLNGCEITQSATFHSHREKRLKVSVFVNCAPGSKGTLAVKPLVD
jgi:hypothetical protein